MLLLKNNIIYVQFHNYVQLSESLSLSVSVASLLDRFPSPNAHFNDIVCFCFCKIHVLSWPMSNSSKDLH